MQPGKPPLIRIARLLAARGKAKPKQMVFPIGTPGSRSYALMDVDEDHKINIVFPKCLLGILPYLCNSMNSNAHL